MRESTAGNGDPSGDTVTPSHQPALRITAIEVENFRLLSEVRLRLEPALTALVGRNNTGKTSLAEVLDRFCRSKDPSFSIEDISAAAYPCFHAAFERYLAGDEAGARAVLPQIRLTFDIEYARGLPEFGPLAEFVIDLDPNCHQARIQFAYALREGQLAELFSQVENATADIELPVLLARIKDQVKTYKRTVTAIDPMDASNTKAVEFAAALRLLGSQARRRSTGQTCSCLKASLSPSRCPPCRRSATHRQWCQPALPKASPTLEAAPPGCAATPDSVPARPVDTASKY